jgi:hypothetical protein
MQDSLWSVDLFRCESIVLKSYWVMVVTDLFTRRIVGIGVEPAHIDGVHLIQAQSGVSGTQKVETFKVLISPPARGLCERVPQKRMCRQNLSRAYVPRRRGLFSCCTPSGRSSPQHSLGR